MDALDGNAIAGALEEYFGAEMTTAQGTCAHCGSQSGIAELAVYLRAPGAVARCRGCGHVVLVVARLRDELHVDTSGFRLLAAPSARPAT